MKLAKFLSPALLLASFNSQVSAQDVIRIGAFNNRDPVRLVAQEKGFLKNENIKAEAILVTNSIDLMRNFISQWLCHLHHIIPRARIDMNGIKAVIELRETIGAMKSPLPAPEKYADERFYQKALAT